MELSKKTKQNYFVLKKKKPNQTFIFENRKMAVGIFSLCVYCKGLKNMKATFKVFKLVYVEFVVHTGKATTTFVYTTK